MKDVTEQLVSSLNEFLAFARGRLLDDLELAADVVQESLLRAIQHHDQSPGTERN